MADSANKFYVYIKLQNGKARPAKFTRNTCQGQRYLWQATPYSRNTAIKKLEVAQKAHPGAEITLRRYVAKHGKCVLVTHSSEPEHTPTKQAKPTTTTTATKQAGRVKIIVRKVRKTNGDSYFKIGEKVIGRIEQKDDKFFFRAHIQKSDGGTRWQHFLPAEENYKKLRAHAKRRLSQLYNENRLVQ